RLVASPGIFPGEAVLEKQRNKIEFCCACCRRVRIPGSQATSRAVCGCWLGGRKFKRVPVGCRRTLWDITAASEKWRSHDGTSRRIHVEYSRAATPFKPGIPRTTRR